MKQSILKGSLQRMSQLIVRLTYMGTFFVTPLLADN